MAPLYPPMAGIIIDILLGELEAKDNIEVEPPA